MQLRTAGVVFVTLTLALSTPSAAYAGTHDPRGPQPQVAPAEVSGAPCPDVPDPLFCNWTWPTGTGTFHVDSFTAGAEGLLALGRFTGYVSAFEYTGQVDDSAWFVVTDVTVKRRTVTVGAEGDEVDTLWAFAGGFPESLKEEPITVVGHPSRSGSTHAGRDWRRARTTAEKATVLNRLLGLHSAGTS